jgi:cytochrome b6-f complex iron-sulfur subunit
VTVIGALSGGTVAALAVLAALNIFAIVFGLSFMRANKQARAAARGELELRPKPISLTRRDFFRGTLIGSLLVFGAEFGAGTLVFLWPNLRGGFGATIEAGPIEDLRTTIREDGQVYVGTGRFYVVPYDGQPTEDVDYAANGVAAEGLMALYQRCVHLGCRVPFCGNSKWFECPCHGSKYNRVGEKKAGPAPRGLDRFPVDASGGNVVVDTGLVIQGPPIGTNTTGQEAEGPACISGGGGEH